MLTSLLSSIQSQLFSKSLVISNLLPLLLFAFANALMCKLHVPEAWTEIKKIYNPSDKTITYSAVLCLLFVVAYALSTLNTALLEMLEGKRAPVRWLSRFLYPGQLYRVQRLDAKYDQANAGYVELSRRAGRWIAALDRTLLAQDHHTTPGVSDPLTADAVNDRYLMGEAVAPAQLRAAVLDLIRVIKATDVAAPSTQTLRANAEKVKRAIRFSRDKFLFDVQQSSTQRQFAFPGVYPASVTQTSNTILAPTRFGNIGRTMRSYALLRYRLDLNLFWGRLQTTVETSAAKLFDKLADAKVRVDALVLMFFLTIVFSVGWTAWLAFYGESVVGLCAVVIGGLAAAVALYELSCEAYSVMADIVRTTVDLCRFQLLRDLSVTPPLSSDDETALWLALGNKIGYADGRTVFFYDIKKQ